MKESLSVVVHAALLGKKYLLNVNLISVSLSGSQLSQIVC